MSELDRERALRRSADAAYQAGQMSTDEYQATTAEIDQRVQSLQSAPEPVRSRSPLVSVIQYTGLTLALFGALVLVMGDVRGMAFPLLTLAVMLVGIGELVMIRRILEGRFNL